MLFLSASQVRQSLLWQKSTYSLHAVPNQLIFCIIIRDCKTQHLIRTQYVDTSECEKLVGFVQFYKNYRVYFQLLFLLE